MKAIPEKSRNLETENRFILFVPCGKTRMMNFFLNKPAASQQSSVFYILAARQCSGFITC